MLELPCAISSFYVAGGVSFLLLLHLWYGGTLVVYHDVRIFFLAEVLNTMIEQTTLGNLECWPLCDVDDKLISILDFVGHHMILLDQAKVQDVWYSLWVIPYRIRISGGGHNFCWCVSLLSYNRHIYIVQRENLWCLIGILHWWMCCMLNGCQ